MTSTEYRVRDYMTATVTTLTVDARLLDAALLIRRTGKRHVPIVNNDGKAIGIISDRDVSRLAPSLRSPLGSDEYNRVLEETPIALAMSKDPITILPDAPVQQAVHIMNSRKISSVLVTQPDGKLIGIITVTDVLTLLDELLSAEQK
jgi:acetoin utilization protein AcuB